MSWFSFVFFFLLLIVFGRSNCCKFNLSTQYQQIGAQKWKRNSKIVSCCCCFFAHSSDLDNLSRQRWQTVSTSKYRVSETKNNSRACTLIDEANSHCALFTMIAWLYVLWILFRSIWDSLKTIHNQTPVDHTILFSARCNRIVLKSTLKSGFARIVSNTINKYRYRLASHHIASYCIASEGKKEASHNQMLDCLWQRMSFVSKR